MQPPTRSLALLATTALVAGAAPPPWVSSVPAASPSAVITDTAPGPRLTVAGVDTAHRFGLRDVFDLEWASHPRIHPDGDRVVYVRRGFDVMEDRARTSLWIVDADGSGHRPLTRGDRNAGQPRWSPSGDRLAYVLYGSEDENGEATGPELWIRWMDTGERAEVAELEESPSGLTWSPGGERLAFQRFVAGEPEALARMPDAPPGADWGPEYRVFTDLRYRADGQGYLEPGHQQLFVVPADGGTPRQVTAGPYDHTAPVSWSPDGRALVFSANRHEDRVRDPTDTEVYRVGVENGAVTVLTDRRGPDRHPVVSPDGRRIAYLGFEDRRQGYQVTRLHVMGADGSDARVLTGGLDRSVSDPVWTADGRSVLVQYVDGGTTRIARVTLDGSVRELARDVGGLSIGRPYSGGAFSLSPATGRFAFTHTRPDHPADVALGVPRAPGSDAEVEIRRLTRLNRDLLEHRELADVEEVTYRSSHDGREIQGWIARPPGFDPGKEYPLLLEIHGGPFANYGERFSAEVQLYAAAGYLVLYTNPRGSTGYGQEFGNLIHHAYPGHDYDDLMSGVDAVLRRETVDPDRLYVTGGSGGGVLSAWIVGTTDRFRAAVVQKPVIDWYSFALTADNYAYYWRYWFPGYPWEHRDHYFSRSPVSRAGDVSTPTMLIVGEEDHRTPASETEQFYGALQLRGVDAAMVRIPDASHDIAARPSNLAGKVAHVLGWLARYGGPPPPRR